MSIISRIERLESILDVEAGRPCVRVVLPTNGRDLDLDPMAAAGNLMVLEYPPGNCQYFAPGDPEYGRIRHRSGDHRIVE